MNLRIVMKLRETIKNRIAVESAGSGVNKRRIIQRAVYEGCGAIQTGEGKEQRDHVRWSAGVLW